MFAMSDGQPAPARSGATVTGGTYRFTVLTSRLIRMEWSPSGTFTDERTQLVASRDFDVPDFTVRRDAAGRLEIITDYLHLRYDGRPFSSAGLNVELTKAATDPHYATWRYGYDYPQRLPLRGNLFGTARTLDVADGATPLEPGILATYGFTTIDDSGSVILSSDGWVSSRPQVNSAGANDLYLFAYGHDYHGALTDYHQLTGHAPLVPRFVLGNWWSRYWPYSDEEYLALLDRFDSSQVPLSVGVIDMDWHLVDIDPDLGTGWTGYTWNPDLFPDPAAFLTTLHDRGLAVTLNVHPADGVRRHEEQYPDMARAMGIDPATGEPVAFDITSREFVDAYLRILHHPLEEQGVDFWWIDWQSGGITSIEGLDPLWMLNHIHYLDSGRAGRRPLTFSRYAGLGSHRYPIGFSGDTIIGWPSLDFQPYFTATAANVGYTWWSHDIGGHMHGTTDDELAVRWYQLGAFSPINRPHSTTGPFTTKEPWSYPPRESAIITRYLRLRHQLVPYIYSAAWKTHTDCLALVRPMYHDYPNRSEAYGHPNESFFGENLLLAPITSPQDSVTKLAEVRTWLPDGDWFDVFTGQRYSGSRSMVLYRTIESSPVLAKAGTVLTLSADPMSDVSQLPDALELRIFPGNGNSRVIEDDGSADPVPSIIEISQTLRCNVDGTADIRLQLEARGPVLKPVRNIAVDIVGCGDVQNATMSLDRSAPDSLRSPEVHQHELLSRSLRFTIGEIDLSRGAEFNFTGLKADLRDFAEESFRLLHASTIPVDTKDLTWEVAKRCRELELAAELNAIPLPPSLRGALIEQSLDRGPWSEISRPRPC